ncbi:MULTISPECIES: hypothetical protein [unclassified Wolbachia]|uniref:hypothetical protein n=1 Tax=unclassified Wolbachia TaxID=2640676 RepID=UPI00039E88BB|nr:MULTISPECIES: hypothetical protein [unclassified Wolbachia]
MKNWIPVSSTGMTGGEGTEVPVLVALTALSFQRVTLKSIFLFFLDASVSYLDDIILNEANH